MSTSRQYLRRLNPWKARDVRRHNKRCSARAASSMSTVAAKNMRIVDKFSTNPGRRGHVRRWEFRRNPLKKKILDKKRHHRQNPLKSKVLDKKLKKLERLGLDKDTAQELRTDLSAEFADPTQAIYILDWWAARLTLQKMINESNPKLVDKYATELSNYANKYQVDPYELSLDDELQIDHYGTLRHFIHLSQTNPYFRISWPKLHRIIYTEMGLALYRQGRYHRPRIEKEVLGVVRQWDSQTKGHSPKEAVKILRGRHLSDSPAVQDQTRIPKEDIVRVEATGKPSDLIEFLKDVEANIVTRREFIPAVHEPFLSFDDGKDWVIIRKQDISAEGMSLSDCGQPENSGRAVLLSLREPIPGTEYRRALLKAEVVFPSRIGYTPKISELQQSMGVVNQLRGFGNSKPDPELHKYIVALLEEGWIGHLVEPDFSPKAIFDLEDLSPADRRKLHKTSKALFDTKLFFDKFKTLSYPARIREQLIDKIELPVKHILEIVSAKSYNPAMRKVALAQIRNRIARGDKYFRKKLFDALEAYLLRTKDKSVIKEILRILWGTKKVYQVFLQFARKRKEWLLRDGNQTFFLNILKGSLPRGQHYHSKALPASLLDFLLYIIEEPSGCTFVIKLLFETRFESTPRLRKLVEAMISEILYDTDHEILDYDTCNWFMKVPGGWGSYAHRDFNNEIPYSRKLIRLLNKLLEFSASEDDLSNRDCYIDLAVTIAANIRSKSMSRPLVRRPFVKKLSSLINEDIPRLSRHTVYEQLGRLI